MFRLVCDYIALLNNEVNMPRKSPYIISLTLEEQKKLESVSNKYTSPYYEVMRAKVILFAANDFDNKQIGEKLGLPRQIVSKWRKRFYFKRLLGLQELPRHGRPRDFSPSSSHGD